MEQNKTLGDVIFDSIGVENLELHIRNNADRVVENYYVIRNFTESEVEELKIQLAENVLRQQELQRALELAKLEFKEANDPIKDEIKELSIEIYKGYSETQETVYIIFDYENNWEQTVDKNGVLIDTKPLSKNHQKNIKFISE